jgi:hypothetical protein
MKSKEEIEYAAANLANPNACKTINCIEGYTQCQEDMADVIDSLKTQLREFQSKDPKYAVEGDYCAVCGCTEFWNNGDEEE